MVKRQKKKRFAKALFTLFILIGLLVLCVYLLSIVTKDGDEGKGLSQILHNALNKEVDKNQAEAEGAPEENAQDYETVVQTEDDMHEGSLILVNSDHPIEVNEADVVSVFDNKTGAYKVKDKSTELDKQTLLQLNKLLDAFEKESGVDDVLIASGYRSVEEQEKILKQKTKELGKTKAEQMVAKPGCSEHHTGMAMDLGIYTDDGKSLEFKGMGTYSFLTRNMDHYGFVLRYPQDKASFTGITYEPWHIRYVGSPHASYMKQENLCLEEYIKLLRSYPFEKTHLQLTDNDKKYEVYFVQKTGEQTQIPVPKNKTFTISGNNVDGFVITVEN